MPFERESISDSSSTSLPAQSQPAIMREERTINPYQVRGKTPTAPPLSSIGQPDSNKEAPVETKETPLPEETVKLSPQMAALARREQKFRQQQQELEKDKTLLKSEREELAQLRAMKEKLAQKDYSGLDGLVDYNDYSQYQINKLNGADPVQDEIKKLNSKISEIEKNAQDNVTKQFEAAVSERRLATTELVDNSPDFPRIKKAKAHEAVVQHILDTWEHDNEELSVAQAAKEVEEILVEKAKAWAALLEEEKKEEATQAEPEAEQKKQLPPLKKELRTLTNQVTASEFTRVKKSLHGLSDSERWAEARRRAEEKLQINGR